MSLHILVFKTFLKMYLVLNYRGCFPLYIQWTGFSHIFMDSTNRLCYLIIYLTSQWGYIGSVKIQWTTTTKKACSHNTSHFYSFQLFSQKLHTPILCAIDYYQITFPNLSFLHMQTINFSSTLTSFEWFLSSRGPNLNRFDIIFCLQCVSKKLSLRLHSFWNFSII